MITHHADGQGLHVLVYGQLDALLEYRELEDMTDILVTNLGVGEKECYAQLAGALLDELKRQSIQQHGTKDIEYEWKEDEYDPSRNTVVRVFAANGLTETVGYGKITFRWSATPRKVV